MSRYSDYDVFASIYDAHWGAETLQALPVLDRLLLGALRPGAHVLDLCCGTGQLARALLARGFAVTGVDGSAEMLRHAERNAPGARFLLSDVRSFATADTYDAALSTFDSLNHIMTLEELGTVFRNVRRALAEGASFLFDVNMEAAYRARWHGSFGIVRDDHAVVARSQYDPATRHARLALTMFHRGDAHWNRTDLTLTQRCYSKAEIRTALEQAGFGRVSVYSTRSGDANVGRSYFLCRPH